MVGVSALMRPTVVSRTAVAPVSWELMVRSAGADALDDGAVSRRPDSVPNARAPVAAQPGRGEGVGHRGVAVTDQQGALQHRGQLPPRCGGRVFGLGRVGQLGAEPRDRRVQPRVGPGRQADLGEVRLDRSGCRARARSASRAATLPDPSQIDCSGASRYSRGIPDSSTYPLPPKHSSASAACAGRACRPSTWSRPAPSAGTRPPARRRGRGPVGRPGQPADDGGRRLGLHRQVGQHVGHSGWSASPAPNALRCAAWYAACTAPDRMLVAAPRSRSPAGSC